MSDYCVAVMGGAHVRFFSLEPAEFPEFESGPRLVDIGELFNPNKEMAERDLYADSKTGRGRAPRGGPAHGYDDHRSQHETEFDRRFARKVMEEARRLALKNHARNVLLVTPVPMVGLLRQEIGIITKHGIKVQKLSKDMTKFTSKQIHDCLAREKLLPECKRPGI